MALTKVNAEGINVADDFAFTGTVSGAGLASPFPTGTAVTSVGGAATANISQGLCKSWVIFNGSGTLAINDSFNLTGVTDNGTGDYTTTFANDFGSVNYVMGGWCGYITSRINVFGNEGSLTVYAAGTFRMTTGYVNNTNGGAANNDSNVVNMMFSGDLA